MNGPVRKFRTTHIFVLWAVYWGSFAAGLTAAAVLANVPTWSRPIYALLAFASAAIVYLAERAGVYLDSRGVTVVQYSGRRRVVPWSKFQSFDVKKNGKGGAWIVTTGADGSIHKTQGLVVNRPEGSKAQALLFDLDDARRVLTEL